MFRSSLQDLLLLCQQLVPSHFEEGGGASGLRLLDSLWSIIETLDVVAVGIALNFVRLFFFSLLRRGHSGGL